MGKRIPKSKERLFIAYADSEDGICLQIAKPSWCTSQRRASTWQPTVGSLVPKGLSDFGPYAKAIKVASKGAINIPKVGRWKVIMTFEPGSDPHRMLELLVALDGDTGTRWMQFLSILSDVTSKAFEAGQKHGK